jgi:CRISPR/Cas system-associated exonuclease Cas4 (RecB family)
MAAYKRNSHLYNPNSKSPFKISRSKIDLFLECPKCFYLDRKLGVARPSIPAFTLNAAVDILLKKEFDLLRKKGEAHEIMKKYKIDAIPYEHPDIDKWRNNFVGKQFLHEKTNLLIFGAVDDIWINPKEELIIVDYKATSTERRISLEDKWKQAFKKQMEVYQWIFEKSGFKVARTAYIVYANAIKGRPKFDGKLEFELSLHPHRGDTSWVEPVIREIKKCLDSEKIPEAGRECEYCSYREAIKDAGGKTQLKIFEDDRR